MKIIDLFRKKKMGGDAAKVKRSSAKTAPLPSASEVSTAPLTDMQIKASLSRGTRFTPQQLMFGCGQSVGKQRDHNEDHLIAMSFVLGGEGDQYPVGLFIIADGMGGYQYGEIASSVASRTMAANILKKFHPLLLNETQQLDQPLQELMRETIEEAQRLVQRAAPGGGTTLTAMLVMGQQLTVGHVGDSRGYTIRADGRIENLTRDHSLVARLEELGQITPAEAATHPQRNVLYRALGQGEVLEADIFTTQFPQPGYLLLCSDGLWSVVSDEEMVRIIRKAPNLPSACQDLVAAANNAGGPDNISVILVQLLG